jgi:arsenite/tail-anchored protein-transporting ATPase
MSPLAEAVGDARFVFVVGKGGTGKSTAAAGLALERADEGDLTHLLSTDPAHSLADVFAEAAGSAPAPSACSPHLLLEEYDAAAHAAAWIARVTLPVAELIEHGTYLDAADVAGFTRLALPGVDELMAVLRLTDLAGGTARVVVDTAPTGHTLRMLDASTTHEGVARALQAMADKAAAVVSSFAGRAVRLHGEAFIAELHDCVAGFRRLLRDAVFVLAARHDDVVMAETRRLARGLEQRGLRVGATLFAGPPAEAWGRCITVPMLDEPRGCDGLRRWRAALRRCPPGRAEPAGAAATLAGAQAPSGGLPARPWLQEQRLRLLVFAGKGGTGKSTCAAAAALALAETRPVLLCSTDPAGSLDDLLPGGSGALPTGLRVVQVDAAAETDRLRGAWREEVAGALERIGLSQAAALDRRVIEALWDLAPPGIDEFAALAALLQAADTEETIVLDPAPTGHFLRLLTLPQTALDWTRQLMRIIVKYQAAGVAGSVAGALLETAKGLRALQELLADPDRTGVLVVTLEEPVVRAETRRLLDALRDGDVPVAGIILNRTGGALRDPQPAHDVPIIRAPRRAGPAGAGALRNFIETWTVSS